MRYRVFGDPWEELEYRGEEWFATFVSRTDRYWAWLASNLRRKWPVPAGLGEDDVHQELLMHAWRAYKCYDPARGVKLKTHMLWRAIANAKRWIHLQRKAKRGSGWNPSRYPLLASVDLPDVGYDDPIERVVDNRRKCQQAGGVAGELLGLLLEEDGNVAVAARRAHAELNLGTRNTLEANLLLERAALVTFSD